MVYFGGSISVSKPKQSNSVNLQNQQGNGIEGIYDTRNYEYVGKDCNGSDVFRFKKLIKTESGTFLGFTYVRFTGKGSWLARWELDPYNKRIRSIKIEVCEYDGSRFETGIEEWEYISRIIEKSYSPSRTEQLALWDLLKRQ